MKDVYLIDEIPTGFKSKGGMYIKVFNRYIKIEDKAVTSGYPDFKLFSVKVMNKRSKTFNYFLELYNKKVKIKSTVAYVLMSYMGDKFTASCEGIIYGITVINIEGDNIKLRCDYFDSV